MAKMTKAQARRMCLAIEKKSLKLYQYGLQNGLPPAVYRKGLTIGADAMKILKSLRGT